MEKGVLVQHFDLAAYERLCGGIVVGHNMLAWLGIASAWLPGLAFALQLLQLLPMLRVICIILIYTACNINTMLSTVVQVTDVCDAQVLSWTYLHSTAI